MFNFNFFRQPRTIRRKLGGYVNDDGYYVPGKYRNITILASVQPLNKDEKAQYVDVEPQGGRQANLVKVYTDTELYPAKQRTSVNAEREGDVLLWQGRLWRCIGCDAFQSGVISHYRAVFQEIDDDSAEEASEDEGNAEEISP